MSDVDTLVWVAPPDDVNAVHEFLNGLWSRLPDVSEPDRMAFETAIIELASNVVEHAEARDGWVSCVLTVHHDGEELCAELTDTAEAGSFRLVPMVMPATDAESGRGIALVQATVDDLRYERIGDRNRWSIVKRRARTSS